MDETVAQEERSKKLKLLTQKIRAIVQRNLREWPRCSECKADFEIVRVDVHPGLVHLAHTCPANGLTKKREVRAAFSKAEIEELKHHGLA